MEFTKFQPAAITFEGRNLQLIACAGSGKTRSGGATRAAPVAIAKYDRRVVVVMAVEEYEKLTERKVPKQKDGGLKSAGKVRMEDLAQLARLRGSTDRMDVSPSNEDLPAFCARTNEGASPAGRDRGFHSVVICRSANF